MDVEFKEGDLVYVNYNYIDKDLLPREAQISSPNDVMVFFILKRKLI